MADATSRVYKIHRRSDVQMAAVSMQREDYYPGLSATDRSALGTVIAELGTNILKYGVQGSIRICEVEQGTRRGILVEARDQGPGIPDVDQALQDHFTTGHTLGLGLPAVKRMSDELGIITGPAQGTRVRALRWVRQDRQPSEEARRPPPGERPQTDRSPATDHGELGPRTIEGPPCELNLEQRIRPCYPERVSGDQVLICQRDGLWLLGIVDGCGHGPQAHAVACAIVEGLTQRFEELIATAGEGSGSGISDAGHAELWLTELLRCAHGRACGSRGAAIGLSLVDGYRRQLWFSGIGNTRILQFKPRGWTGVSRDGQLGDRFPTPLVQGFPLHPADTVVQFSDGLRESQVRQLRQSNDPKLPIAALADRLMSVALRTDDASVLVWRCHN